LCNAHALRELQAVTDTTPADQWCWAQQSADALRELSQLVKDALATSNNLDGIDAAALAAAIHRYHSAALLGAEATRTRASKLMAKHHALARRLIDRQDDYLRFTTDPGVPFDNNAAEREVRMVNCDRKSPGACGPSPEPNSSAPSAATSPPPPNMASISRGPHHTRRRPPLPAHNRLTPNHAILST
jgi:transposase